MDSGGQADPQLWNAYVGNVPVNLRPSGLLKSASADFSTTVYSTSITVTVTTTGDSDRVDFPLTLLQRGPRPPSTYRMTQSEMAEERRSAVKGNGMNE